MSDLTITNNEQLGQFETTIDGHTGLVAYRRWQDAITFTHTEVPKEIGGRGVAQQLAKTALDFSREHHLQVVPICPFVKFYIARHPEYQDLVRQS